MSTLTNIIIIYRLIYVCVYVEYIMINNKLCNPIISSKSKLQKKKKCV